MPPLVLSYNLLVCLVVLVLFFTKPPQQEKNYNDETRRYCFMDTSSCHCVCVCIIINWFDVKKIITIQPNGMSECCGCACCFFYINWMCSKSWEKERRSISSEYWRKTLLRITLLHTVARNYSLSFFFVQTETKCTHSDALKLWTKIQYTYINSRRTVANTHTHHIRLSYWFAKITDSINLTANVTYLYEYAYSFFRISFPIG